MQTTRQRRPADRLLQNAVSVDFLDYYDFVSRTLASWRGYREASLRLRRGDGTGVHLSSLVPKKFDPHLPSLVFIHGFADNKYSALPLLRAPVNVFSLDWPRHGSSQGDDIRHLDDLVAVLDAALAKIKSQFTLSKFTAVVATSLGVPVSALLSELASVDTYLWVAPPFLSSGELGKLIEYIRRVDDVAGTADYMGRVLTRERHFPDFVWRSVLRRKLRASPFLDGIDLSAVRRRLLAVDPQKVRVLIGGRDRLIAAAGADPELMERFGAGITRWPAYSHDLMWSGGRAVADWVLRGLR